MLSKRDLSLSPIEYAAIGSAGFALVLALTTVGLYVWRARRSGSVSGSGWGAGSGPDSSRAPSAPAQSARSQSQTSLNPYQPAAYFPGSAETATPVSSRAPASASTLVDTPVSGRKKARRAHGGGSEVDGPFGAHEDEVKMVTYEEGLRRMGIEPPDFSGDARVHPHPLQTAYDTPTPAAGERGAHDGRQVPHHVIHMPSSPPGPALAAAVEDGGGARREYEGRAGADGAVSAWLPSYYRLAGER
ncbi:hypothetical protein Q5752_003638 [Cryptotrichosporon argae]